MKVIREKFENFPDDIKPVATSVEGQALEDTAEFDKRKEETEKEIQKQAKLPVDGAPKAIKPEEVKVPDKLTEAYDTDNVRKYSNKLLDMISDGILDAEWVAQALVAWCSEDGIKEFMEANELLEEDEVEESFMSGAQENNSDKSLDENINEQDAARIVLQVLRNSFGIDTDIESYNDALTKTTIILFVIPESENNKVIYDEFKEQLYKRFNNNVNISCKTFSSPNLSERRVEYKIKVLVIKEKKNKYGASNVLHKSSSTKTESINEDILPTLPYMRTSFSEKFLKDNGIIPAEKTSKLTTAAIRIKLRDWINNNFEVKVPMGLDPVADKGEAILYNPSTGEYSCDLFGTKEALQSFKDKTGLGETIGMTWGPEDYKAAEAADEAAGDDPEDNDLVAMIYNELSSDMGWSSSSKKRRIPATSNDDMYKKYGFPLISNDRRYRSDAESNELTIDDDGNIIVKPSEIGRGSEAHTLDFAKLVAKEYSDYNVKFQPITNFKGEEVAGKIIIPQEYQYVDLRDTEKEKRAERYKDAYAAYKNKK